MPTQLTGTQIAESLDALRFLSSVDDKKKPIFAFKPKTKILLAKKLRQVQDLFDDLEKHRKALLEELGITGGKDKDGKDVDDPAALASFHRKWAEYLVVEQEIDIGQIDEALLDMGDETTTKNDIPFAYLTILDWLISWTK